MKQKTEQTHDQHEAEIQRLRLLGNPDYQRLMRLSAQIQQQLDAGVITADIANEAHRAVARETLAVIVETAPELYRAATADRSFEMWSDYASGADQDTGDTPDAKEARRKQALELVEAVEAHRAVQTGEINEQQYTQAMRPAFPDVVEAAEREAYADYVPDSHAEPVDLDSPAMQAYQDRMAREHAEENPNVVPDTKVVDAPRSF